MNIGNSKEHAISLSWIIGGVIGLILIVFFSMMASYKNTEASLINEYQAQEKKIEAVHDAMWKIIQQKAGVASEYSSKFDEIYTHIMDSRYQGNDGVLFNWIKESNPNFTMELYKELSQTIEVQRKQFLASQERIIDICREYNNLITQVPSGWFLSGKTKLDYEVISSSRTKDVMQTRLDDDTDLWKN